jgi:tetratricopeptide (TPR) repeat protein
MAFQGDLRNIGLATVFQNLQQNLQSGTLRVKRQNGQRFIYVTKGSISMVSAGAGTETPLAEYLRRAGKITPEDIEAAEKRCRKGQRLGSALEKNEAVEPGDVEQAVTQYVEEELYELFTWPDGAFDFREGEPSGEVFDSEVRNAKLSLDPSGIILEAARRVDEWERIDRVVGGMNEVYVVGRAHADEVASKRDARLRRVAGLLDGTRDVAAVIRDSALGRFAVSKVLSQLISDRLARPISADELRALAEQAESADNLEQAKTLLRRALDLERNDTGLRRRLAKILENTGEKVEAASQYKLLANSLLDRGRSGEAADCLRRAIDLMPTDVGTRERLFKILSESGSMTVVIETGLDLAGTYSGLGLNEKARAALERMLSLNPKDRLPLERKLVEANLALGDVKGAVGVLRKIARRHLKERDYEEAGSVYEEILKLEPKDDEARKRVAEIQAGAVERMLERRRRLIRSGIAAAVAFLALIFVVREIAARPAETEARIEASGKVVEAARALERADLNLESKLNPEAAADFTSAAGRFDEAAAALEGFRGSWSWTLASRSAAKEIDEWRRLAARARLSCAEAFHRDRRFDDEYRILRKLSRSTAAPAAEAGKAEEVLQRLLKEHSWLVGRALEDDR